jgi:uncharacterized DUF497 family protein
MDGRRSRRTDAAPGEGLSAAQPLISRHFAGQRCGQNTDSGNRPRRGTASRLPGQGQWKESPPSGSLHVAPCSVYIADIYWSVVERNDPLDGCSGFEWDESNTHKNWERHRVSPEEAEDLFFNEPLVVRSDIRHSRREKRYYALGQTSNGRYLFVAFTIRRSLVRVISVRDMNRRERDAYVKHENEADA